jgi:hypothetical protein
VNLGVPEEEAVKISLVPLVVLMMAVALPAAIPETLRRAVGAVVPIPTLPEEPILSRSVKLVEKAIYLLLPPN